MNRKKVLIITYSQDNPCVGMVSGEIKKLGLEPVLFNTDLFPEKSSIEVSSRKGELQTFINQGKQRINGQQVKSVWYRRSRIGESLRGQMKQALLSPVLQESQMMMWAAINSLPVFHLDHYMLHRILENKLYQLTVAEKCGLKIPPNLYTNSRTAFNQFYKAQNQTVITKMFSSFAIYENNEEQVVFTTKLEKKHLKEMGSLQVSPMSFQKNIAKKRELRITIVGKKIFTAAVDSQKLPGAQTDWRVEGEALVKHWYPYPLPVAIEKKLLRLMDTFQLNYGAIDIIETPRGEFYYLETNSGGEYFWLDHLFDHGISKAIAGLLCGKEKGRQAKFY
jgi:glutathione synthase/RimK-type ligase-like ATP-grasp enzyme